MTDKELWEKSKVWESSDDGRGKLKILESVEKFAALIRAENPVLKDSQQYRMQMAAICTAAVGYWTEYDSISPDYDTLALRDVAKLYAKYDALYKTQRLPLNDSFEREKYTYGTPLLDAMTQDYVPPQRTWVGLTRDEQSFVYQNLFNATSRTDSFWVDFANAVEAKLKEKNNAN